MKVNKNNKYKTKNMNLQLFGPVDLEPEDPIPPAITPFYNYFYLDEELANTIFSGAFDIEEEIYPTHLYIVYHNSNIYGIRETQSEPTLNEILVNGQLILENVNPEYTGSFYTNPNGEGTEQNPYYLVEDEVVEAGYFADFTTYHTAKISQGYSSTIIPTNCSCTKSSETGLSGSYSATITADGGYYLADNSVTSTLGTVAIATNKRTATVTIEDVTENFTITAQGTLKTVQNVILHPNNDGVTDYTTEMYPEVNSATSEDIQNLFN